MNRFLGKKASMFYIGTVILVQPYWILEITANFVSPFLTVLSLGNSTDARLALLQWPEQVILLHPPIRSTIPGSVVDLHDGEPSLEHQVEIRVRVF
jgi:hypothetical protein